MSLELIMSELESLRDLLNGPGQQRLDNVKKLVGAWKLAPLSLPKEPELPKAAHISDEDFATMKALVAKDKGEHHTYLMDDPPKPESVQLTYREPVETPPPATVELEGTAEPEADPAYMVKAPKAKKKKEPEFKPFTRTKPRKRK